MKSLKIVYKMFLLLILGHTSGCTQSTAKLSPQEVYQMQQEGKEVIIIDVRTPEEFTGELGHIPGSILSPLQQIEEWESEFSQDKNKQIIMVCRSGNRSGVSTQYFLDRGYKNVFNMSGGMRAWNQSRLPIETEINEP